MSSKQFEADKQQLQEELVKIQSFTTVEKKSFDVTTAKQRLNYHRENILGDRDRQVHYNRKACDQARAMLPKPWRATLPPKNSAFDKVMEDSKAVRNANQDIVKESVLNNASQWGEVGTRRDTGNDERVAGRVRNDERVAGGVVNGEACNKVNSKAVAEHGIPGRANVHFRLHRSASSAT